NAIETNKKIFSLQPSDRESSMNIALAYYRQKGYKSSITWSEKALALNLTEGEKKSVNSMLFDSLLNQGRIMAAGKKYREGEKYFLKALNIKKNNLSARKELAGCYLHIGINYLDIKNRREGKNYFNKVIGLNTGGEAEKQARHYIASMTPGKNKTIVQTASKEENNKEIAYNYEKTREDNYIKTVDYKENIPSAVKETKVVAPAEAKASYDDIKLEDGGEDSKL
ncbi:MAG: tetratricopeptide repeat protein, partial [Candidatus Eremiobacterota bacterium]